MANFFRLLIASLVLIIIVPQNPTENILLRTLSETGLFPNYSEARKFLDRLLWILIAFFLIITFFTGLF